MNAAQLVTANFSVPGFTCGIGSGGLTAIVSDAQLMVNEALGAVRAGDDLNRDGVVNVADVQKVIDAALGMGCLYES
jgi:hypothetical protein